MLCLWWWKIWEKLNIYEPLFLSLLQTSSSTWYSSSEVNLTRSHNCSSIKVSGRTWTSHKISDQWLCSYSICFQWRSFEALHQVLCLLWLTSHTVALQPPCSISSNWTNIINTKASIAACYCQWPRLINCTNTQYSLYSLKVSIEINTNVTIT